MGGFLKHGSAYITIFENISPLALDANIPTFPSLRDGSYIKTPPSFCNSDLRLSSFIPSGMGV